jgi:cytochrome c oxidase subunit 1
MHFIGLAGLPRRYYTNTNFPLFDDLQNVNVLITMFALVGGVFQLVFFIQLLLVVFSKKIGSESMEIKYLEWTTPVEHIHGNWRRNSRSSDGLMITLIQDMMKISFHKRCQ